MSFQSQYFFPYALYINSTDHEQSCWVLYLDLFMIIIKIDRLNLLSSDLTLSEYCLAILFYFSQIWWCLVTLLRMSTQPIWVSLSLTEVLIAELRQYCLNTEVLYWTSRNKLTLNWILLHDRRNIGRQSISYQRKRFWKS